MKECCFHKNRQCTVCSRKLDPRHPGPRRRTGTLSPDALTPGGHKPIQEGEEGRKTLIDGGMAAGASVAARLRKIPLLPKASRGELPLHVAPGLVCDHTLTLKKAAAELNYSSSFHLSGALRNRFGAFLRAPDCRRPSGENGIYRGAFSLREERNAEGERPVR